MCGTHFEGQVEGHVGSKIEQKTTSKIRRFFDRILEHLGIDFGGFSRPNIGSRTVLNIGSTKSPKWCFRLGESSIFENLGRSEIVAKSVENDAQHDVRKKIDSESDFGRMLGVKLRPCWRKNRTKNHIENISRFLTKKDFTPHSFGEEFVGQGPPGSPT